MTIAAVIPARYHSSRFPGKPLADICGKPMVQHVYERAKESALVGETIVATEDARIADVVRKFGGKVVMTSPGHRTGTERVAEVAGGIEAEIIANIQGDEPLIEPAALEALIPPFEEDHDVNMTTLARPAGDRNEVTSANTCKIVLDGTGDGLYFSRAEIPYYGETQPEPRYLLHVGTYAFRRDFLLTFAKLEKRPLEVAEGLEMLRALEHGYKIRVVVGPFVSLGVDTEDDLARVREHIESNT